MRSIGYQYEINSKLVKIDFYISIKMSVSFVNNSINISGNLPDGHNKILTIEGYVAEINILCESLVAGKLMGNKLIGTQRIYIANTIIELTDNYITYRYDEYIKFIERIDTSKICVITPRYIVVQYIEDGCIYNGIHLHDKSWNKYMDIWLPDCLDIVAIRTIGEDKVYIRSLIDAEITLEDYKTTYGEYLRYI